MDLSLVEKWLEQGERIESRHLNVLKKNQANEGITDATDYFRKLYYRFDKLSDKEVEEATKVLNNFQRGKASGDKGREVVKNFLSSSLTLLTNKENRTLLKQYLDKNGKMPIDNSEDLRRHEEERRREQERLRRQQEEAEKKRREDDQRRQREEERRQREEERQRKAEDARKASEQYEQDIDHYTAEREQYVVNRMKSKKYNIPWKGLLKTIVILFLIYIVLTLIGNIRSCTSSSSPIASNITSQSSNSSNTDNVVTTESDEEDEQDYGSPNDGLLGSIPIGTTKYVGDMDGYPIEIEFIKKSQNYEIEARYKNVNYGTTMSLSGESLPAQGGDITFYGKGNGRDWIFDLTGDADHITGTAQGDGKTFKVNLHRDGVSSNVSYDRISDNGRIIDIISYRPSERARNCKLSKVEVSPSSTRIYGVYEDNGTGNRIWWNKTAYITTGDGKIMITDTEGVPMAPDSYQVSPYGKREFVLIFPTLPDGTKQFDFIESDDSNSWRFYDIRLSEAI